MIIKIGFEELEKSMSTVTSLVSDKLLSPELKNLIVWLTGDSTRLAAFNENIVSATEAEAEVTGVDMSNGDVFFQLSAKDINDVLATFRGLKRTVASHVEFHIDDTRAVMHVFEEPIDDTLGEQYNLESKFNVAKPTLKDFVKNEVRKINFDVSGDTIESIDFLLYVDALLPQVINEKREATHNVMFSKDYIYAVLATHTALMENKLVHMYPTLEGFKLQNSVLSFIKNCVMEEDTFILNKNVTDGRAVVLTLKVGNSVSMIRCADMSKAFDISNFVSTPDNKVAVDKAYLTDVLKRMSLSPEASNIEIVINDGLGSMRVSSKAMTQNIPIVTAKGSGSYKFGIRADILASIIFSHATFGENVFISLEQDERGRIELAVADNTDLWQTKVRELKAVKGDFAWS